MNYERFKALCENAFGTLVAHFDFRRTIARKESAGVYKYDLINDTTAVRVVYEQREWRFFVQLCRLVRHEICPGPGEMRPDSVLHCYSLDDLLALRKPRYEFEPQETSGDQSASPDVMIHRYASDLATYGADILNGDFRVFVDLDRIVKNRARLAAHLKWGERAKEFGWD